MRPGMDTARRGDAGQRRQVIRSMDELIAAIDA